MHAATHGHVECIALMVAQGVDVDAQNVVRVVWCGVCVVWAGNYIT